VVTAIGSGVISPASGHISKKKPAFPCENAGFMEMKGLEPMTLCLQSRCSPN